MSELIRERIRSRRADGGFTLVELLIVIVILGILAGIVVVAVSGITNRGQSEACSTDRKALETSQEAAYAQTGHYMTEAQLVSNNYIKAQSTLWNFTMTGTDPNYTAYTVTAQGTTCA
jgi:prepilin-type N-terminal cleavage/methylation domain-containing protein